MYRILVAYATMSGSTAEVARVVGEEIGKSGAQVDVLPLDEAEDLEVYDGVVGGLVRHVDHPGSGWRPPELAGDPALGGGATGGIPLPAGTSRRARTGRLTSSTPFPTVAGPFKCDPSFLTAEAKRFERWRHEGVDAVKIMGAPHGLAPTAA